MDNVISHDFIYATRHSVVVVHVTLSAMLDMPVYFKTLNSYSHITVYLESLCGQRTVLQSTGNSQPIYHCPLNYTPPIVDQYEQLIFAKVSRVLAINNNQVSTDSSDQWSTKPENMATDAQPFAFWFVD